MISLGSWQMFRQLQLAALNVKRGFIHLTSDRKMNFFFGKQIRGTQKGIGDLNGRPAVDHVGRVKA